MGGRFARSGAVFLAFLAAAMVFTFPLVANVTRAVPDTGDPLLDAWVFGWVAHQLARDPIHLFDANRFYPETGTLAFTDPMLALTVPLAPFQALADNPILTLNVAMLLSLALSGLGAYRLAHYLTGDAIASGVAGSIFAFNPYRLSHLAHVNLQAAGFIPLTFLCLIRFLEKGRKRDAVGLGAFLWLVSASCAYYGVFTWIGLAVAVPYELARTGARERPRRVLALGLVLGLSALAYLPLAMPLIRLDREYGMTRPLDRLQRFSARPIDYLRSGADAHRAVGFEPPRRGKNLFPGIVALGLSFLALLRPTRVTWLFLLVGGFAFWASLGPDYWLYSLLHTVVPGVSGLRAPPRFVILVMLALSVLAALAVAWIRSAGTGKLARFAPLLIVVPLLESTRFPNPYTEAPLFPPVYEWLRSRSDRSPVVEVPITWPLHKNALYLYWSTRHYEPLANGHATLVPPVFIELRRAMEGFPDRSSMELIRNNGFELVILHKDLFLRQHAAAMEEAMDAEPGLQLVYRTENERVYRVLR